MAGEEQDGAWLAGHALHDGGLLDDCGNGERRKLVPVVSGARGAGVAGARL